MPHTHVYISLFLCKLQEEEESISYASAGLLETLSLLQIQLTLTNPKHSLDVGEL